MIPMPNLPLPFFYPTLLMVSHVWTVRSPSYIIPRTSVEWCATIMVRIILFIIPPEGLFSTSWQVLGERLERRFDYNPVSLSAFLQRGILKNNHSALSDVHSLGAGEKLYSGLKRDSVFAHAPKVVAERHPDVETYSLRYGELHAQAIRRRIGDSRRVGILLSGGYDSGSNLAALRSIYDGQIDSYSVGFKGDTWTELPMARLMSETFGTRHHEYEIDGTEISALPDIVRFLGEPFMEGGLMVNYCAMRMIGDDKPDVILGGDGSDQYFGTSGREVALHYLSARIGLRPLLRGISRLLEHETFDTGGKLSASISIWIRYFIFWKGAFRLLRFCLVCPSAKSERRF